MEYKGFFKTVNTKPTGDSITVFISDWHKEHWAFYVHISRDNFEADIDEISQLMDKLNYRDGDVYIELIDYEGDLEHFYKYVYDSGYMTHSAILDKELWEILDDKGNEHFLYFTKLNGSTSKDDLRDAEYLVFEDWYDVLETYHPDLYKALDESNGLGCFNIEHFFNCSGFVEIDGQIVSECC
jgi:hypothetical protein